MRETIDIELCVPFRTFGNVLFGSAQITVDIEAEHVTACNFYCEKRDRLGQLNTVWVDAVTHSEDPVAALILKTARDWLKSAAGRNWLDTFEEDEDDKRALAAEHATAFRGGLA